MNKELERLALIIEAVNAFHAQLIVDNHLDVALKVDMIRNDMFWLFHEMGQMDS